MNRPPSIQVDRPVPGHYQGRLNATLSCLPVRLLPPRTHHRGVDRRAAGSVTERGASRQLALPLRAP